ncbi:MAG: HAD-IIIA family hydrolase [Candidatus Woesearchaeota archaeon]
MAIVLICSDRDGTINKDEDYYLGASEDWKSQLEFLPGVVDGIKLLNSIPNSRFVILTNQSGVALTGPEFDNLTEARLEEVNQEIVLRLNQQGARSDAYFSCPFVDHSYVKKAVSKGRKLIPGYINDNHPDLKPNIGLIKKAAKNFGYDLEEIKHRYMIGDRLSDIEMGLEAGCVSILVSSYKTKQLDDLVKARELQKQHPDKVSIADDFLEAAKLVKKGLY